jgi:hypothetical protein
LSRAVFTSTARALVSCSAFTAAACWSAVCCFWNFASALA